MSELELLDAAFLFRFEFPLLEADLRWGKQGLQLPERCRLPRFSALTHESQKTTLEFADVRMAWSASGLGFTVNVQGKKQLPWCRSSRAVESDGFSLFVDTRNSQKLRRGNRFCHSFMFSPIGDGPRRDQPFGCWLPLQQTRELSPEVEPSALRVFSRLDSAGYELSGLIPAAALHGYDPQESPQLGLTYWVRDRELGQQSMSLRDSFPFTIDPSLWGTAHLVPAGK